MAPTTADHDLDAESLTLEPRRRVPALPTNLTTFWCVRCFRISLLDWDDACPFEPRCWMITSASKKCGRCYAANSKCETVYRGIRGHVFELMALLEFAKQYWRRSDKGLRKTDIADVVFDHGVIKDVSDAVWNLCISFDNLVKAHGEAHMLTGNASNCAKAAYSAWCNSREHAIRPLTMHPYNLARRYASQATEHLRLRLGEEMQIHWAAAICAFRDAVEAAMRSHHERLCATQEDHEIADLELIDDFDYEFPLEYPEL